MKKGMEATLSNEAKSQKAMARGRGRGKRRRQAAARRGLGNACTNASTNWRPWWARSAVEAKEGAERARNRFLETLRKCAESDQEVAKTDGKFDLAFEQLHDAPYVQSFHDEESDWKINKGTSGC